MTAWQAPGCEEFKVQTQGNGLKVLGETARKGTPATKGSIRDDGAVDMENGK
jgi:hypothetical protein